MLTKNEIAALNLSPTKKDFVQIWNELLDVAGKLSERWDPTSTNEGDPGIVILKALTGIADKLNYNIDKNTLEAFMPTAAQDESMRKLCEMLGYNIKYNQSAKTDITIKYYNADPSDSEANALDSGLVLPKFTTITNSDQDISYFTVNQKALLISSTTPSITVECMEGQVVKCESINDNYLVTASQIAENNRFYLPETQIAENGIFIYNAVVVSTVSADTVVDGTAWEKVDNLNTQPRGSRVFKFGYDSYESRPYIEFPEDFSELFNEGIFIYYTRTSGVNGNISAHTLTQLELPTLEGWSNVSTDSFSVDNLFATTTGTNIETIEQAYNNFKKTIGTFDTLVTCRDYMNKIYSLVNLASGQPYVSNVLVTDIRNDLNKAITICSCDDAGIFYKEKALLDKESEKPLIDHFDLVLYPYKTYSQIKNKLRDISGLYNTSFDYNNKNFKAIVSELNSTKLSTVAHDFKSPKVGNILSINNYLKLDATIATNTKVDEDEGNDIIINIKVALANAFNMRELDFGEEIPFESILKTIEGADERIRVVSLNEPSLYTTFSVLGNNNTTVEYAVASNWLTEADVKVSNRLTSSTFNTATAKQIYNKLAIRNILAGRVPLFNYNTTFNTDFSETVCYESTNLAVKPGALATPTSDQPCTLLVEGDKIYTGCLVDGNLKYTEYSVPKSFGTDTKIDENTIDKLGPNNITKIIPFCELPAEAGKVQDVTLEKGEFIKFRAPNFSTTKTYPAYVNYHLKLANSSKQVAEFAEAQNLFELLDTDRNSWSPSTPSIRWQKVLDNDVLSLYKKTFTVSQKVSAYSSTTAAAPVISDPVITINTLQNNITSSDAASILAKCGCIKLSDASCRATLSWTPDVGQSVTGALPDIAFELTNPFITSAEVVNTIKSIVDNTIAEKRDLLPTTCAWTISFTFEYIPFEASSLDAWYHFIAMHGESVFGFIPKTENGVILWRLFGDGYDIGKYVTENGNKLLKFDKSYFGLLPENNLSGIYIAKKLGKNTEPKTIKNNEEYELQDNEALYIEYTPSSTAEDGTTQDASSVLETYGTGTIIRPSGFDAGLIDSTLYAKLGNTAVKTVSFGTESKDMFKFGANEQVEIREFAKVVLSNSTFKSGDKGVWIYKNFNNCEALEKCSYDNNNKRINNTYTLKDNEYIYYTDQNKAEFAFFTSGTEVTLTGKIVIPSSEIIEEADIIESGPSIIPWAYLPLTSTNDCVEFQEYQYITLGPTDKINNIELIGDSTKISNDSWIYCDKAEYTIAGKEFAELPKVSVKNRNDSNIGCGWEVSSFFEFEASPSIAQNLRYIPNKIETGITLAGIGTGGAGEILSERISPKLLNSAHSDETSNECTLTFKTNLACQSLGSTVFTLEDVYLNPNKLEGFEFKLFTKKDPEIVKTLPGKVIPFEPVDYLSWAGEPVQLKSQSDFWNQLSLTKLAPHISDVSGASYDNALRLSVCTIPKTYGIVSFYLTYEHLAVETSTRIEVLPGFDTKKISILNAPATDSSAAWKTENDTAYLELKPGITCLRFDSSCDFFIKASSQASGNLYFDDVKLVNCETINYTLNNSSTSVLTKGLNLKQIKYQPIEDSEYIAEETRIQLKEALVEETKTKLQNIADEAAVKYEQNKDFFIQAKPALDMLNEDVENYSELSDKDSLINAHSTIKGYLDTETKILDSLNDPKIKIEESMLPLANQFASKETAQRQLLNQLDELSSSLDTDIDSIVDSLNDNEILDTVTIAEIIDAKEADADTKGPDTEENNCRAIKYEAIDSVIINSDGYSISNIQQAAADLAQQNFNADFNEKLSAIAEELNQVSDSENKSSLATILATLQEPGVAELGSLLSTKIIAMASKVLDLYSGLQNAISANNLTLAIFYTDELINIIQNENQAITGLLERISDLIAKKDAEDLAASVQELYNLFNSLGTLSDGAHTTSTTFESSGELAILDSLLSLKAKFDSGADIQDTTAIMSTLQVDLPTFYFSTIKNKLASIKWSICSDGTVSTITQLTSTKSKEISSLAKKTSALLTEKSAFITDLEAFKTGIPYDSWDSTGNKFDTLDYCKKAYIEVWPMYFKNYILDLVPKYRLYILNSDNAELIPDSIIEYSNITKVSELNERLINFKESIKAMHESEATRNALKEIIGKAIGSLGDPVYSNLDGYSYVTIKEIIAEITRLSTLNTVAASTKKVQLRSRLKLELEQVSTAHKELLAVLEDALYKNAATITQTADKSSFAHTLATGLITIINDSGEVSEKLIKVTKALNSLTEGNTADFKALWNLVDDQFKPTAVLDKANSLIATLALALKATEAKEALPSILAMSTAEYMSISDILAEYKNKLSVLSTQKVIDTEESLSVLLAENQLLEEIRSIDTDKDFFYTIIPENFLAMELGSEAAPKTLMNPSTYYDINNINNSFVISKLDIDYLGTGLQIAWSSKLK